MITLLWATFVPTLPFSDFQVYHETAIKLSQGNAVLSKNMGYCLLLSAGYRIYPSVLTGKLINATASTLSILILYIVGSKLINQRAGLIAAFLFALLPSEILMVSVLGTEVIGTTFVIITSFFIFYFRTTDGKNFFSLSWMFWAGLFFGLALTIRFSYIFYFPAIYCRLFFITFPMTIGKWVKSFCFFWHNNWIKSYSTGLRSFHETIFHRTTQNAGLIPVTFRYKCNNIRGMESR